MFRRADVICRHAPVSPTPLAGGGASTIDDGTSLECFSASPSRPHTLAELKDEAISGVTQSTPVAVLAWMNSGTGGRPSATATADDVHATVDSLTINGVEQLEGYEESRGKPSTRSATMFLFTSSVPPPMCIAGEPTSRWLWGVSPSMPSGPRRPVSYTHLTLPTIYSV